MKWNIAVILLLAFNYSSAAESPSFFGVPIGSKVPEEIDAQFTEHPAGSKNGVGTYRFRISDEHKPFVDGEAKATPVSGKVYYVSGRVSFQGASECRDELFKQRGALEKSLLVELTQEKDLLPGWVGYKAAIGDLSVEAMCMHNILLLSYENAKVKFLALEELLSR